jgi:putative N6-adenine-specific DNA methylase
MKIISHTPKKHQEISYDPSNIRFTLTCQSGLESLVRRESEKIWLTDVKVQDRLISGSWKLTHAYELLVRSRFANRVYINIHTEKITSFDTLHDALADISWSEYLTGKELIVIEASSTRSALSSIPTIQSVSQKAIFSTLHTPNNANAIEVHILILIVDDIAHILLDITGDPLHKRGYRQEAWEAPIKENLASALVAFTNWKYREPLFDPFCGSGTIAIEAAMLARNIAPWVNRHFRIESLPFHMRDELTSVKNIARMKAYPSGEYKIYASDINPLMIEIAERNAERAWVSGDIHFSCQDAEKLASLLPGDTPSTIITNPPYGNRLQDYDFDALYSDLEKVIEANHGGFITSFERNPGKEWSNKKLLNGSEECRFWYKKN